MSGERALIAKAARGEAITPIDHIGTIDTADELDAFKLALTENGRMTDEILVAIYRREALIGARHSR